MSFDFSDIFTEYEKLAQEADTVFEKVRELHGECVKCNIGCSDCCHALFDLSLVEAMYINEKTKEYMKTLSPKEKKAFLEETNSIDRQTYKLKRKMHKEQQEGAEVEDILTNAAKERIRCALLDRDDKCLVYESRPITCRLYGVPLNIGGESYTCGRSAFEKGEKYPAVQMDRIQNRLNQLSQAIADRVESKHEGLVDLLVPVSMAILTDYDKEYLGVSEKEESEPKAPTKEWVLQSGEDKTS